MNTQDDILYSQLLAIYQNCLEEIESNEKSKIEHLNTLLDELKKTATAGLAHTEAYLGYLSKSKYSYHE